MRRFIASGFGLGFIPRMLRASDAGAGTVGAFGAAGLSAVLWAAPVWFEILIAAAFVAISVWATAPFKDDPGWVTIDEQAGVLIAFVGLSGIPWVVAFVVFRLADIFKQTPGVGAAERLPGGWGITGDDVVAGFYGLAAGWAVALLM